MKRGKSRPGRFPRGDNAVAGEDRTLRRLRAACLACRLLALAACAAGLALAVQAQANAAHPAGAAAPGLTLALLGAIVAALAGRQR
jgi:hypothetical protein